MDPSMWFVTQTGAEHSAGRKADRRMMMILSQHVTRSIWIPVLVTVSSSFQLPCNCYRLETDPSMGNLLMGASTRMLEGREMGLCCHLAG